MRRAIVGSVMCVVLLAGIQPASAATASKFIDTSNNEWTEAVVDGFTAWAADTAAHKFKYRIHVKPGSGAAYLVNPDNTNASVGNIELDGDHGDLLVYSVERGTSHDRNVAFWDLGARRNLVVPSGVNTSTHSEQWPSVSGDHLVFTRGPKNDSFGKQVVMYTFSTKKFKVLDAAPTGSIVSAGAVNGDYVVYDECPASFKCHVFRYQISTDETKQLPNGGRAAYYPSVTADGTVYHVQGSSQYCGQDTQIRRWRAGTSSLVAQLDDGIEIGPTDVREVGDTDRVFFTRIRCTSPLAYGIWKVDA